MRVPTEDELQIIADKAPEVFEMAKNGKTREAKVVVFMVDAFGGEPELLHAVIWYLTSQGLEVRIIGEQYEGKDES